MARQIKSWQRWIGGIADFQHESPIADSYYFGRSIDVRSDPHHISILPRTIKESGTVVTDLIKWGTTYQTTLDTYMYGDGGAIYKRTSARSYSKLRTVNNSHGNGMAYNPEDDYLYYTLDKVIGRYGPLGGTPSFVDDYFGSQGGVPLNTNSLDLESSSSQYADRADTASLSITGNLSIRAQIKPESLPTVGNTMAIVAKWTENGNARSYRFDIAAVSGYFGDGSDSSLTISVDTTEAPIDSACTGTISTTSLSATNASFAANQIVLIHQSQGTGAGTWQRNTISSYTAGTITLRDALNATYGTSAQVRVMKQYTNVTINSGKTYTVKAWNGTVGGILAYIASGTVTVTGTISGNGGNSTAASGSSTSSGATGGGFRGGDAVSSGTSYQGEGTSGTGSQSNSANGNGGGGGYGTSDGGGGGGGNGASGSTGTADTGTPGTGGSSAGSADLTTMVFGGGGGGGGTHNTSSNERSGGGSGGAIIFISAATLTVSGAITANGGSAADAYWDGGGGGGGSILLKAQTATLGSALITATGGTGGGAIIGNQRGGNGSVGRIHLDYYTSYTGTTSPTLDVTQDNSLVTSTTYQLRLSLSSNGTNVETLAQEASIVTGSWQQVGVAWTAASSSATFYLNAVAIGTRVGAFTSISDNASRFAVGKYIDSGGSATAFYDGLIDEVQVFNNVQAASDFVYASTQQISTTTSGLQAYYKLNGDYTDATANANNLAASGSPVFSSDVPFPSPTTRTDIDQSYTTTGSTYTLPTAISEASTERQTFTPAKDPQKSIGVSVDTIGTGNWTLTVHDAQNRTIASKTIANASMTTGDVEFIFSSVWRPLTNFTNTYHFHVTSTVADGKVVTSSLNDLETAVFYSYYQYLVEDTSWHGIANFLNFIVILNERYLAKYEATLYEPNKLVFGAGWRARCYGYWNEYLAIGCMRGTNIYDFDMGRIYFWDGYSPTFNFFVDVPEGGINALLGTRGKLLIWAGYHADLLEYSGGSAATKVKEVPLLISDDYAEVYPGAVAMWMANPRYGLAGASNSTDIQRGVYTWGSTNYRYPDILTFDYPISTGNYGSTVKVGMVMPINQELLISWKDNTAYGVDYVNVGNAPFPTATVEMMIEDMDMSYKQKEAYQLVSTFDPLLSGESINVKYRNEETDTGWNSNADSPATGDITIKQSIANSRYYHLRVAADLSASGSTSPTLKSIALVTDTLEEEDIVG